MQYVFLMATQLRSNSQEWVILCHNIRGINSDKKWNSIKNKVQETKCEIICLQETKRETFDDLYLSNFCPRDFDSFCYTPLVGSLGGTIIIWKSSKFQGSMIFQNDFGQSVEFCSKLNGHRWTLTDIYAPCTMRVKSTS
jgi:exonuclease III